MRILMKSQPISAKSAINDRFRLTESQVETYERDGYLHLPDVLRTSEVDALRTGNDQLTDEFVGKHASDESPVKTSEHVFGSGVWAQLVRDSRLVTPVIQLVGPNVEFHHTNARTYLPTESGRRELHQDRVFYPHENDQFVNVLVYFDDFETTDASMRFVPGSHLDGKINHLTSSNGLPRVPSEAYEFDDSVPIPASAGDIVLMHIDVVHGSVMSDDASGSLAWVGYNDPENAQLSGQAADRTGFMIAGNRP